VRSKARSPSSLADQVLEAIKTLRHLAIDDHQVEARSGSEHGRPKAMDDPVHSVSLVYG
jgi:hypothetical protein